MKLHNRFIKQVISLLSKKEFIVLSGLFTLGVVFRLWFVHLVPQPLLIGDQYDYNRYAVGILHHGLFALSSRLYGFPLFLAIIYGFFGEGNTNAVIFIQSVLDVSTAFLMFWMAQKIFKKSIQAYLVLVLYLFNPFTSNFAGLILTEVLAVFSVILVFATFLLFLEKKTVSTSISLMLLLGFLPQIRPPFLVFTLIIAGVVLFSFLKRKAIKLLHRFQFCTVLLIFYFLPFLYTIIGNKVYFDTFSPVTVDNIFVRELYISLFIGRSPAHAETLILDPPMYMFPPEVKKIYVDIARPTNKKERVEVAQKYFQLSLTEIQKNPVKFIVMYIKKMWYVWEKHFIFYYFEPESTAKTLLIYWSNVGLLIAGVFGLIHWIRQLKQEEKHIGRVIFGGTVAVFFVYISLIHSFSLSEERYSLPGYPFVFLFFSYFLWFMAKRFLRMFKF